MGAITFVEDRGLQAIIFTGEIIELDWVRSDLSLIVSNLLTVELNFISLSNFPSPQTLGLEN